ncbi:MAG: helix-turn-helix transcriptional regulator [Alphaproteobacteria bacterium]|nr:helix-turn-helix transcriptional regulator [Alphaproteobacteria bacterium]
MSRKYGQYCPIAKAAEVIGERWTLLILREIMLGSCRFNEIKRGIPLISTALLSKRLGDLEFAGVIKKVKIESSKSYEYHMTKIGKQVQPIIVNLGLWGQHWLEDKLGKKDLDMGALMWDVRRRINAENLPDGRTVLHFEFPDAPKIMRMWWIVVEHESVDLCYSDPGYEVDLYVSTDKTSMAHIWLGKLDLKKAIRDNTFELIGDRGLIKTIESWFLLSKLVEITKSNKSTQ